MTDMDDELRELLQRKADDVAPHLEVPRSLASRGRLRVSLNALGVGVTVLLLAAGTIAGLRAVGRPPAYRPLGTSPSTVQPTPSPSMTPACTSALLRSVGSMEGAAGSRVGAIGLTNLSEETCTLQGTPAITLLDQNLDPIISDVSFGSSPAGWVANGSPEPPGWPVVALAPGDSASVRVSWSNWCPNGGAAPLWRIEIPGGGLLDVNGMDSLTPPPCNGQGLPSTIEVGPFEPGAGS